ncbi:hypothetical protein DFQ27_007496 [Actinomortierella ambigua]|uniref:Uncharacterized protein n=1 Tax=Actinomortierella ambigua TaxID=1343610 RepID=A0A9P6PW90_9FUNG|nr:hypothetical protein DFQ27_007496 [Actinomortierella ambigua]
MIWSNIWTSIKEMADQFVGTKGTQGVPEFHECDIGLSTFSETLTPVSPSTALFYHGGVGSTSVSTFQLMDEYHDDIIDPETGLPPHCNMWELQLELLSIPGAISSSINLLERCDGNARQRADAAADYEDYQPSLPSSELDEEAETSESESEEEGCASEEDYDSDEAGVVCAIHHQSEERAGAGFHSRDSGYSSQASSGQASDLEAQNAADLRKVHDAVAPFKYFGVSSVSVADSIATHSAPATEGQEGEADDEGSDIESCIYLEEVILTYVVTEVAAAG